MIWCGPVLMSPYVPVALFAPLHFSELKFTLYLQGLRNEKVWLGQLDSPIPYQVLTEFSFFDIDFEFHFIVFLWIPGFVPTKYLDLPTPLLFIHNITTILHIEIFVVIKQRIKDRFQCSDEKLFYHEPSKSKVVKFIYSEKATKCEKINHFFKFSFFFK